MIKEFFTFFCELVAFVVLIIVCVSCEKEPICDSVEQQWRLEFFTILDTKERVDCENLFYCITHMVTEVSEKTVSDGSQDFHDSKGYGAFIARTSYGDNKKTLVLSDFKVNGYNTDLGIAATVDQLRPFGINNPKMTIFRIMESSHNRLVLESEYARLVLRKF